MVCVGNTLSNSKVIPEGILQGFVLSCTCFMIAIDEIISNLPQSISATLYVDDLCIFASGSIPHLIEHRLQNAINSIVLWTHRTGFKFSPWKTFSMHICRRRGCSRMVCNLTIGNNTIVCVEHYKFLGLYFDTALRWKHHVTQLKVSVPPYMGS